jgi:hypothetical protein
MDIFWTDLPIEDGGELRYRLDEMQLIIRQNGDELTLASLENNQEEPPAEEIPWSRFVTGSQDIKIRLTPRTPDKPVVVNPEHPVQILPGQSARFFILLPAWIEVSVRKPSAVVISEIPTAKLSVTWFGGPMDGILSYSLNSPAIRRTDEASLPDPGPLKIITPLYIRNRSEELLSLQDLNIHCEHLKVYEGASRNWSNEIHISFYGGNQPSKVYYVEKKPAFEEMSKGHSDPRIKIRQDLLAKSYSFMKNFTA